MERQESFPGEFAQFPEEDWLELHLGEGRNAIKIGTYRWKPENPTNILCVLIHGMGSCGQSYAHVAQRFSQEGITSVACDYRCFGRSTGEQGNFKDVDDLVNDHVQFFTKVREHYPDHKIFLFGQSLGGLISIRLSLIFPGVVSGLMLYAPFIQMAHKLAKRPWIKATIIALSPLIGGIRIPRSQNNSYRIQACYDWIQANPLYYHGKIKLSTVTALARGADHMLANLELVEAPMQILRAGVENLVDNDAIQALYDRSRSTDKVLIDYPESWHAMSRDVDAYDMFEKSVAWIKERS